MQAAGAFTTSGVQVVLGAPRRRPRRATGSVAANGV